MYLIDWTFVVLGIGIGLIALLFGIFQYFNKRGSSKALVLKKSFLVGGIASIVLYTLGIIFCVEHRIDSQEQLRYVGRIADKHTQAPLRGVKVVFEYRGIPMIQYTDSEGLFTFRVKPDRNFNEAKIRVAIENYDPFSRIITVRERSGVEEIFLRRKKTTERPGPVKITDEITARTPLDTVSAEEAIRKESQQLADNLADSIISLEPDRRVTKKEKENEQIMIRRTLSGRVLTRKTNYPFPVKGVVVIVNDGYAKATTDKDGFFKIDISDTSMTYAVLIFEKEGYDRNKRSFKIPKNDIQVFLEEVQ